MEDDNINEYEVWHGLAKLYSILSHWKDAETCLTKARMLKEYSAETLHTEGKSLTILPKKLKKENLIQYRVHYISKTRFYCCFIWAETPSLSQKK